MFFWDLQSEGFLVGTFVVFDPIQSLFLERSFDPMQNVVRVMLLGPKRVGQIVGQPLRAAAREQERSELLLYLQGLNRGERLKLPSFWEING